MTKRLLVVDDEFINRDIIIRFLEEQEYDIETADDGVDAWNKMESEEEPYDVILLDKMMPNMNGIELLQKIKSSEKYNDIPVIMQSAATDDKHVIEGINAGAYYYLMKPYEEDLLTTIVKAALIDSEKKKEERGIANYALIPSIITEAVLRFTRLDEAEDIAEFFATLSSDHNIKFGLNEILVNAVEHGNLNISYDEKSELNNKGVWLDEIESRLEQDENKNKQVELAFTDVDGLLTFIISDEGDGFNWQEYLELSPKRAFDNHGRGIAFSIMKTFDTVEYQGKGNVVKCTIDLNKKNKN